jgi:hypothetical protein
MIGCGVVSSIGMTGNPRPGTAFANFFHDRNKPCKQRKFRYPLVQEKTVDESFALWVDQSVPKLQA